MESKKENQSFSLDTLAMLLLDGFLLKTFYFLGDRIVWEIFPEKNIPRKPPKGE